MEICRSIFLLLASLAAIFMPQVETSSQDGQIQGGIEQVSIDFHERIVQLREGPNAAKVQPGEVSSDELNLALARTKLELLQKLPTDAIPLRNYVQRHFPGAVTPAAADGKVGAATIQKTVTDTDSLLNTLKKANPYRLDLIVDSEPRDALFELQSPTGESLTIGTRGTLTNVWRGEYQYKVSKSGSKTISGTVDLIRERGDRLICHFVPSVSSDGPLPCQLTAGN